MRTELINILLDSVITISTTFSCSSIDKFCFGTIDIRATSVCSQPSNVSKFTKNVHNELPTIPIAPHSITRFTLGKNSGLRIKDNPIRPKNLQFA